MNKVSYAAATKGHHRAPDFSAIPPRSTTIVDGEEMVVFSSDEVRDLSRPFQYSLVGTFVFSRPSLATIEQQIKKQVLLSDVFFPGALDEHHVLLRFTNEEYFLKVYL
jgi:hypothetical protein